MHLLDQAAGAQSSAMSIPGVGELDDIMPAVAGASLPVGSLSGAPGASASSADSGDIGEEMLA
jgi:hypothetical protein